MDSRAVPKASRDGRHSAQIPDSRQSSAILLELPRSSTGPVSEFARAVRDEFFVRNPHPTRQAPNFPGPGASHAAVKLIYLRGVLMVAQWTRVVVSVAAVGFSVTACSQEPGVPESARGAA